MNKKQKTPTLSRPAVLLAALLTALLLSAPLTSAAWAESIHWGLTFSEPGQPPVGPASSEQLAQYDAVYLGDTAQKTLYLTFDAGYENGHTASLLDTLKKHDVPAAFFVVGAYIESNPELTRRMCQEGHMVGNHTYHHPDMSQLSEPSAFREELDSLAALYQQTVGQPLSGFYRPPRGVYSQENLRQAQSMGVQTVFWSLAYVDWLQDEQPTRQQALDKLLPRTHPGAIVLLHSTSQTNAEILDELLTVWKAEGYRFGRLEELYPLTA